MVHCNSRILLKIIQMKRYFRLKLIYINKFHSSLH